MQEFEVNDIIYCDITTHKNAANNYLLKVIDPMIGSKSIVAVVIESTSKQYPPGKVHNQWLKSAFKLKERFSIDPILKQLDILEAKYNGRGRVG